ncbi:hypothetical protein STCU_02709 [Strigomonas culicis]|uniref:Methyltransferase n=1 Tax=Strigomonas culicis TaxID=28005 RepID=S9UV01_9TRYP|nr:hypothetical protein STCU_02709 [Strigomonas culicis]|eukprot:EPY32728.1 hypothetical protein STCU_02709 [Strigomonas culicis]
MCFAFPLSLPFRYSRLIISYSDTRRFALLCPMRTLTAMDKKHADLKRGRAAEAEAEGRADRPAPGADRSRLYHPFRANFNDHFETSIEALRDVLPVVRELQQLLRPSTPERFTLYDPYYCSGTVKELWAQLEVPNVVHENVDFYAAVEARTVPPHDMLVTNPPFSDDHIERFLRFVLLRNAGRPWAMLAPDYVVTKPWYRELVERHCTKASRIAKGVLTGAARPPPATFALPPFIQAAAAPAAAAAAAPPPPAVVGVEPFYIVPRARYDYRHPVEGAAREHSHFKSMWYVWAGRHTPEVVRGVRVAVLHRAAVPDRAPQVLHGLEALEEAKCVTATERRPNPQQRARHAQGGRPSPHGKGRQGH